ncbi:MAG: hypothetical protein AAB654_12985 [Acidobacteriota bacterium]
MLGFHGGSPVATAFDDMHFRRGCDGSQWGSDELRKQGDELQCRPMNCSPERRADGMFPRRGPHLRPESDDNRGSRSSTVRHRAPQANFSLAARIGALRARFSGCRVVVLSNIPNDDEALVALGAVAPGYTLRTADSAIKDQPITRPPICTT